MRFTTTLLATIALAFVAIFARPASGNEAHPLAQIDADLAAAAAYLDVIRDNDLAAPQYIEKMAEALVTLAGQRNDLVAQERQLQTWRERYDARSAESEAAADAMEQARHRLSPSDAAKTLGLLRRMHAALRSIDGRLADADDQCARAYEELASMADGLVAELARVLRAKEYESALDETVPASRPDHDGPRFDSSEIVRTGGTLRKLHGLLAGVHERMREAMSLCAKAHERMAPSAPSFGRAIQDMLHSPHAESQS